MYFLGLDMGTSYFKAGLFDENGKLKGIGRAIVPKQIQEKSCEILTEDFWQTVRDCVQQALTQSNIHAQQVAAMSYSSQANTFILCDEDHKPLTNFIVWNDTRATITPKLQLLSDRNDWSSVTGIGAALAPEMCIAKIIWFQKQRPEIWQRTRFIKTISDYLTYELTGNFVADTSSASLTGLLDSRNGAWWQQALSVANIDPSFLPQLQRPGTLVGNLFYKNAERSGLSTRTTYCIGGLDHHMAATGAGIFACDEMSESTGTVIALVKHTNDYSTQPGCYTSRAITDDNYFQMAFDENGAAALQWYHRNYAPQFSLEELLMKAALVCNEGLAAKPCAFKYAGLQGFSNIQPYHHHGHFVRAILESTAKSLNDIIHKLNPQNQKIKIISTGGGAKSILWSQIKADIIDAELYTQEQTEAACSGAAMLAAKNYFNKKSMRQIQEAWRGIKTLVHATGN